MFQSIGIPGLIIILVIILIIFGPKKLPQLGRSIGETLKNFKESTKGVIDDVTEEDELKKQKKLNNHIFIFSNEKTKNEVHSWFFNYSITSLHYIFLQWNITMFFCWS